MEAMAAMDFSTLSRRELQALSKLNGVRANMSNVAMAEALQSLPSVRRRPKFRPSDSCFFFLFLAGGSLRDCCR